jgi:peptide chain release factor 1
MNDKDLHIQVTRGSGPGGQHKNKVETCVIITHMPTGLKERCQDTRSRHQNTEIAKQRLAKKIIDTHNKEQQEIKNKKRIELIQNQKVIRTYNYQRNEVYDNRTKSKHNLKKFMKGEIDI